MGEKHYYILGLYNDKHNTAIDFLFNHINHLPHVHICGGDYNLHSLLWDSILGVESPQAHLALVSALHGAMGHTLASPLNVVTHIPDNIRNRATVIDLVWADSDLRTQVKVDASGQGLSDHALIEATLDTPEWSTLGTPTISRDSEAEAEMLQTLASELPPLLPSESYPPCILDPYDIPHLSSETSEVVTCIYNCFQHTWNQLTTPKWFCGRSAQFWTPELTACKHALQAATCNATPPWQRNTTVRKYSFRARHHPNFMLQPNWSENHGPGKRCKWRNELKAAVRKAHNKHWETHIWEVLHNNKQVWDLTSWMGPRRSSVHKDIIHEGETLATPEQVWPTMNRAFHAATNWPVDCSIMDKLDAHNERDFPPFSMQELHDAIAHTTSASAPGWDHMHWRHLKHLIDPKKNPKTTDCILEGFQALFNCLIEFAVWPEEFHRAVTVVIPKPNKPDYSKLKAFRPIVLLSCTAKWLEKVINNRLQFNCHKFGILHPCQFGSAWQKSTTDAITFLTMQIKASWKEGLVTSMLGFDVAQFFPSVNHDLLIQIMSRAGFNHKLCKFTSAYFGPRTSSFVFNGDVSPTFDCPSVGVGQGSSLSPTFSVLYLALAIHAVHSTTSVTSTFGLQFYVDDSNLMASSTSTETTCHILRIAYHALECQLFKLGLVIEHDKDKLIHFPPPCKQPHMPHDFNP